jgi:hypothetical protein
MSFEDRTADAFARLFAVADRLRETAPDHPMLWEFDRVPAIDARWRSLQKKWPRVFAGPQHRDTELHVIEVLGELRFFAERIAGAAEQYLPPELAGEAKIAAEEIQVAAEARIQEVRSIPEELAALRVGCGKSILDLARDSQTQIKDHNYEDAVASLKQLVESANTQLGQVETFLEKIPLRL